jgi:hypothetical protein
MKGTIDVELRYSVESDKGEVSGDVRTYEDLTIQQVTHLEARLINVLWKLNKFSDDRAAGRPLPEQPSNENPGTVRFEFVATKDGGELFARQTNEWPNMGEKEIMFMKGLYEGELATLDRDTAVKVKKGRRGRKAKGK